MNDTVRVVGIYWQDMIHAGTTDHDELLQGREYPTSLTEPMIGMSYRDFGLITDYQSALHQWEHDDSVGIYYETAERD